MVRYELILHRRPKIGAKEVEKRFADMPKELSKGTLERALENLDGGSIPIAWGGSRKRLRSIQRRIEILGGATELVDHGGALAKALTSIGDEIGYFFGGEKTQAKSRKPAPRRDPTTLNYLFLILSVVAAGFALIFARGVHDAAARLYATQGSGILLGVCTSQVFVRGVRRWFTQQGRAWVSACMLLVPVLSLSAAGYEAYALGIVQQSAAKLAKQTRRAQPKPLMKPFTALMVELKRRKQREELAAALASAAAKGREARTSESTTPATAMTSTDHPQPAATGLEPAPLQVPESILWQPPEVSVREPLPARPPTWQEQLEGWQPLRTVSDVNELHVAAALVLALLTFAIGLWSGRKTRVTNRAPQPSAAEPAPEAAPAATAAEPEPVASPEPAIAPPPAVQSLPEPAPVLAVEAAPLPAAANENSEPKPLAATGTEDRKAKRKREGLPGSAYSAHGSIQEERVLPKRRDARRDD